jgi:sulfite exporter TauE/SafE
MLAQAATTWSPARGFLSMVAFGIGTTPALLLPGLFASVLTLRMRLAGQRAAALGVVAMGAILLTKGVRALG